jgi:lipopolysaccharide export system protein LptA
VPKKKLSAISLLPNGSQLHGVMFPRYDEKQILTGVLKAKAMTLVNAETVAGDGVVIEFFNPDGTRRGRADLTKAVFNQAKGTLNADEPVSLHADRISAKGNGLIYAFQDGEGFLTGPVTTWMQAPTETTMNTSPLRSAAIAGMALITPLQAAEPPQPAAPTTAQVSDSAKAARDELRADLDASAAATRSAREFLEKADIVAKTPANTDAPTLEAKPLDIQPGPTDTVITCDGGMYFDSDTGVFVYLKNIKVTDPRFNLTGANKLEIHLSKKPEKTPDKSDDKKTPGMGLGAKFGDVENIIATGAVKIVQKEVEAGKEPVQASGAIFTYHPKTGHITLSGGYPWVMQGATFMRAEEPNLTLNIEKSGSFKTEGKWKMGGNLDQKQLKPDGKPKQNH